MQQKQKQINWTTSKFKTFVYSNNTIKRVKGKPMEWEKILANHVSNQGLTSRIYKELLLFDNKINKQLDLNMDKGIEQTVLQIRYTNGQ